PQCCAHLGDRFGIVVLEEKEDPQVSMGIDVLRIERDELPKDWNGELGLLFLQVLSCLLLKISDGALGIGCTLCAGDGDRKQNHETEKKFHRVVPKRHLHRVEAVPHDGRKACRPLHKSRDYMQCQYEVQSRDGSWLFAGCRGAVEVVLRKRL